MKIRAIILILWALPGATTGYSDTPTERCEIEVHWNNELQTIAANGINFEGYHSDGAAETLSPRFEEMMDNLPGSLNRLSMPLKAWEPMNDNDDPDSANPDNFKYEKGARNTFLLMRELKSRGVESWLSVWDLPDWNVANPASENQRRVKELDEMAESVVSFLMHGKKNYGVEPLYVSVNEPTVATENGWGGYHLSLTPEEQIKLISKTGRMFRERGIETRWLIGLHKVYPSEVEQAKTILEDSEARKYIAGFDFHGYGMQSKENEQNLRDWGQWAGTTGLITFVGEADYDSAFWKKEERKQWIDASEKYSSLIFKLLNLARVNGIMPWYANVPFDEFPYRFVSQHYMAAFPAGTLIIESSSSCGNIHVTAGKKGKHGAIVIYNASSRPVTVVIRDKKYKVYESVSSRDNNYMSKGTMRRKAGKLELTLPAKSLHTLNSIR